MVRAVAADQLFAGELARAADGVRTARRVEFVTGAVQLAAEDVIGRNHQQPDPVTAAGRGDIHRTDRIELAGKLDFGFALVDRGHRGAAGRRLKVKSAQYTEPRLRFIVLNPVAIDADFTIVRRVPRFKKIAAGITEHLRLPNPVTEHRSDQKRLRQPFRFRLNRIARMDSVARTVAGQTLKRRLILRVMMRISRIPAIISTLSG